MAERIPCKTEGCSSTILPATAAKTGGICMPCQQEQVRQEQQAYIEQHRKTVNLYEGLTNLVDILKVMHAQRTYSPLIQYVDYPHSKEHIYVSLTAAEAEQMLKFAVELLDAGNEDEAEQILLSLVCYRNDDISKVLPKLIERDMYYPSILFKDAPPEIRERFLQQVEWDDDNRNHILIILSWIGDAEVVRQFEEWRLHPPKWAGQLFVNPDVYALEGGWELASNEKKRDLISERCYAIRLTEEQPILSVAETSAAHFLKSSNSNCPWCKRKLTILMDADTTHPSLAYLGLPMERLQVATCEHCGGFSTIYMELDQQGEPVWSRFNQKPDYLPNWDDEDSNVAVEEIKLTLSSEPHSPYYAATWTLTQQDSQIGGHPSWVQDADFPHCPCCAQRMRFIGQLDWADFDKYGEGIFYMFICTEDRMTATLYQQS
ncbi:MULTISPECIES: hypothetical protein [Paenibacillus]|uniref:DUF1963 domain-containing protein n=1 Tax=Paenibacillus alvei TaxID=44250 RepID=A0ABT4E8Y4_PAEAL|nr:MULTISPECIES: hypothetical protein [Paenibacillus]MCY9530206.1 DUF1963 domain-containing protein [Paenibacillus alvei]SDF65941.1 hypothetical protein SAMN04488689_106101 [Paenibacillus sp. cl6col]